MSTVVEHRQGRLRVVELSELRGLSWISILAGVFVAYAVFPVLLGVAGGVTNAMNLDLDLSRTDWREVGTTAGLVAALLLLVAWSAGAYVAGRMAQRSGVLHGVVLFATGLLLLFGAAWLADLPEGPSALAERLRAFGVPVSLEQWGQVASVAGVVALGAMLGGSLLGGALARRFQSKVKDKAIEQVTEGTTERV
ncbi:MAG: hypothetical protein ACRDV9_10265 [Acidimicrobiia bacterium]